MQSPLKTAGLLLFIAGFIILMGIITAESLYPADYATAQSEISDLGATRPPNSVIYEPSASIFNGTMLVTGLLVLAANYFLSKDLKQKSVWISTGLIGFGLMGVGFFPGNYGIMHPIFAMTTFIAGGLAAILSSKVIQRPFKYVVIVLGLISLISLFAAEMFIPILGDGGVERWVAYPIVLWLCGFGGYLLAQPNLSPS